MEINWKRKLTSRKFWTCVCNFISMLLVALKVAETDATQIVALVMAGAGVITYIIGEGMTDAADTQWIEPRVEEQPPGEGE